MSHTPDAKDVKEKVLHEIERVFKVIDHEVRQNRSAAEIIGKTGQRPAHVVVAIIFLVISLILYISGVNALCNLIGFAYPIYASFKALKTDGQDDDTQWLMYWIVFGFFTLIESLFSVFHKSAFYYVFKVVFLVWAMLPQTRGAEIVFDKIIDPILVRYEGGIETALDSAKKTGENLVEESKGDIDSARSAAAKRATRAAVDQMLASNEAHKKDS
jgi:receptor expression-enhancing protein 5/6